MLEPTTYSDCRSLDASFDDALSRTRTALAEEGFGVVSEIDVQATLNEKLGVDRERYTILGACNPRLADQALSVEPQLGALLPCNVSVFVLNGQTYVSAISAEDMLGMVDNPSLAPIASEIGARLEPGPRADRRRPTGGVRDVGTRRDRLPTMSRDPHVELDTRARRNVARRCRPRDCSRPDL